MKNTKSSKTKKNSTIKANNHCGLPAQYAMRAECQPDCVQIRAVLGVWLSMWREDSCYATGADGSPYRLPDVDIVFSMVPDAPSIEEVRWLVDCLVDCHVPAETLTLAHEYTGERVYLDAEGMMRRPSDTVIKTARECAKRTRVCLRADFGRIDEAVEWLSAELSHENEHIECRG